MSDHDLIGKASMAADEARDAVAEQIRARRAALQAEQDRARLCYDDLEAQRDGLTRTLAELMRHLDARAGAIQELGELMRELCASPPS